VSIAAGVVGLATIAPAVVWARADQQAGAFLDRKMGQVTVAEVAQYYQARDTRNQALAATSVLLATGAILAAATGTLYLLDRR
jgi:hypothetical protein